MKEGIPQHLALNFLARLCAELTPDQWQRLCERNKVYSENICASHDFVDANEIMAQAFEDTTQREIDIDCESDCELWSEAWRLAKNLIKQA